MWEITKVFEDVQKLLNTPLDTFSFYYEIMRAKDENEDKILLVFNNEIALKQCFYKSKMKADFGEVVEIHEIDESNIYYLQFGEKIYEFVTLNRIYKTNWLKDRKYKDIQFKNAYDTIC